MSKQHLVAHVNCSPYKHNGEWHIALQRNYFSFMAKDDNDGDACSAIDHMLNAAMEAEVIDSYLVVRAGEPEPRVDAPLADEGNGQHI